MFFGGWGGNGGWGGTFGNVLFHCDYFAIYPESFSSLAFQTKKLTIRIHRETNRNPALKTPKGVNIRIKKKTGKKRKSGKKVNCGPSGRCRDTETPWGGFGVSLSRAANIQTHSHYLEIPLTFQKRH